jgi:ankyrin repeat protein
MRPELLPIKDYAFRIAKLYGTILKKDMLPIEDYKAIMQVQDEYQRTILHYISIQGAVKAINSAVKTLRANTEVKDFEGNTPLHYGAIHYSVSTRACLLFKGANSKAENNYGQTYGDISRDESLRSIGKLSSVLRDLITNPTGLPADAIAAERIQNEPEEDWLIRSLVLNITTHTDGFSAEELKVAMVNTREAENGDEFPPLQLAAELGNLKWVKALIRAGANPERVPSPINFKSGVKPEVQSVINNIIEEEKSMFIAKERAILDNMLMALNTVSASPAGGSPGMQKAIATTAMDTDPVACESPKTTVAINVFGAGLFSSASIARS